MFQPINIYKKTCYCIYTKDYTITKYSSNKGITPIQDE